MEKTAKEMFVELGYEQVCDDKELVQYQKPYTNWRGEKGKTNFVFNRKYETWYISQFVNVVDEEKSLGFTKVFSYVAIDMKTTQAITQQMKELGWIE